MYDTTNNCGNGNNDFDLYHQIGYLVATGMSIKKLLDLAMNENSPIKKSEFREKISGMIRDSVKFVKSNGDKKEEIDYADLNYEQHKVFIQTLLLLFNVETYTPKGDEDNAFHSIATKMKAPGLLSISMPKTLKT